MNKLKWSGLLAVILLLSLLVAPMMNSKDAYAYTTGKYGSGPYNDIITYSQQYGNQYNIKKNMLAAIMMAISYAEAGNGDVSNAPSPMTLGRGDFLGIASGNENLYSFGETDKSKNPYIRAFWNPGVGLWQIDSAGMGQGMDTYRAINTNYAADVVAKTIASKYSSSSSSTTAGKRAYAWSQWYACKNTTKCEDAYNDIYDESTDTLHISVDSSISEAGGVTTTTCSYSTPYYYSFTCYKYDIANSEGYTDSFYYTPYEGGLKIYGDSKNNSPFPLPFYMFSNGNYEYRYWSTNDTNYDETIYKWRNWDSNARSDSNWSTETRIFNGN